MKTSEDKDYVIALQRKKIDELCKLVKALDQEISLLNQEVNELKSKKKAKAL